MKSAYFYTTNTPRYSDLPFYVVSFMGEEFGRVKLGTSHLGLSDDCSQILAWAEVMWNLDLYRLSDCLLRASCQCVLKILCLASSVWKSQTNQTLYMEVQYPTNKLCSEKGRSLSWCQLKSSIVPSLCVL